MKECVPGRLMWVRAKVEKTSWVFVTAYRPVARFSKSPNVKKWNSMYETESNAHKFVVC